jgi:4-amino-4-deoxy-L-arabinose transferase-like glycosyltransferase
VLVGALALRLVVAAVTPLTEDEAYYRLWSLRPDVGYYDHPPMVAWLIWAGRQVAGDTPLGVRLMSILATTLTSLLAFDLARVAGLGKRVAVRGAIWLSATFLVGIGGVLAVPDAANALFWTAALCCAFRTLRGHPAWWLGVGLASGLACLSKYSALFLAPGLLLWLATTSKGRRALATPWPWLAALIAGAVFAPNVAWNAAHGWLTFDKQFGRAAVGGWAPGLLIKFIVDQFLLLNPLIAVFLGLSVRRLSPAPLLAICAPFALYLGFHSLHDEVQGQWPAPLYPALVLCAAAAADRASGWLRGMRTAAPWIGLSASFAVLVFVALPSAGGLPFRDPTSEIRGWRAFAAAVEQARTRAGAAWVGGTDYGIVAELADWPAIRAPAAEVFERQRYSFELPSERANFSRPGVVVIPPHDGGEPAVHRCFAEVTPLPGIDRGEGRSLVRYRVFRVTVPLRNVQDAGCGDPGPRIP